MLFQISHRRKSAFAALLIGALSALPGTALAQSSIRVHSITPTRFSALDGTLQGEIQGQIDADAAVHVFGLPGNAHEGGWKISPLRLAPGAYDFRFPSQVGLNSLIPNGLATFFVSPSEDGSHLPSPRVLYQGRIELPAPEITSAVGGRRTVTLHGRALPSSRVELAVAGHSFTVLAGGSVGDWSHTFQDVPAGKHVATAKVVDVHGTFPASAQATRKVEAEADMIRPLSIVSPAPGFPVQRHVEVRGVASPGRGPVRVQVGGGAVVEAFVHPTHQVWQAWVTSPVQGRVPLTVSLPATGESITQDVQVAPFGEPEVDRLVRHVDAAAKVARLMARGSVNVEGDDFDLRYLNRDQGWTTFARADEEGRWEYDAPYPRDLRVTSETIGGTFHREAVVVSVPSRGDRPDDGILVPLLRAGPELTSSLKVRRNTTLAGRDPSGVSVPIEATLSDGRVFTVVADARGEWSLRVEDLPVGRLELTLGKTLPAQYGVHVESTRFVLDVEDAP